MSSDDSRSDDERVSNQNDSAIGWEQFVDRVVSTEQNVTQPTSPTRRRFTNLTSFAPTVVIGRAVSPVKSVVKTVWRIQEILLLIVIVVPIASVIVIFAISQIWRRWI